MIKLLILKLKKKIKISGYAKLVCVCFKTQYTVPKIIVCQVCKQFDPENRNLTLGEAYSYKLLYY